MISYAVFCLKKKRRPPRATPLYSAAASDVYKRQFQRGTLISQIASAGASDENNSTMPKPVSYTHLRAHETRHDLVCRLLLEKKTSTTESYTSLFGGSVRCV